MTYSQHSKRRKHQHETPSSLALLSNVKSKKHDFALEINSESRSNQNTDAPSSWSQHDLTQTNEQINLFGNWKIGIKSCLISNSLASWPKNSEIQSTSFVKLGVKFEGKKKPDYRHRIHAKPHIFKRRSSIPNKQTHITTMVENMPS